MDGRVGAKGNEVEKIGNMDVLIKSRRATMEESSA